MFAEIIESTDLIASYISGQSAESFRTSRMCRDAVAMRLIVIGEAANRLSRDVWQMLPQMDWQGMANLRHMLAHDYGAASPTILWTIATAEAPMLAAAVASLADD
ncbi:MAG: HepT-like ribonuclease domain-containing protein [Pseudomonadota bacterium]